MLTQRELLILKRRAAGETQSALAAKLSITPAAVCKTEKKALLKVAELEHQLAVVKSLGIDLEDGIGERHAVYHRRDAR